MTDNESAEKSIRSTDRQTEKVTAGLLTDLHVEVATLKQHVKDASERMGETLMRITDIGNLVHTVTNDAVKLLARIEAVERRLEAHHPTVTNCRQCHRKLSPQAAACGVCGTVQ